MGMHSDAVEQGTGVFTRPARLAGNAAMAAATASRSLREDPLTFAVQLARRFPAARTPLLAAARRTRGAERELAERWLSGDLAATRALLSEIAGRSGLGRLGAEIAHAAGRPELVADDARITPVARARAAWQLGEATRAIALLAEHAPKSRLHRVLRAELAMMTPGMRLRWNANGVVPAEPHRGILHLLTNSLPHTQSGYTVRSHAVLQAQRDAGLDPVAMTRVGYPVVVGKLGAAARDVIDGIAYHRVLPSRLAATPDGRLAQQAEALGRLARSLQPAALQTTTHYPNAVVTREVAERLRIPWAYEVRGMLEQTWVAGLGSAEARERAAASERFHLTREREAELASAADAVFTLSGSMRDDLVARGVPADRIALVPNAIDASLLERQPPAPADARGAIGLPREGFWVGSTSSLVDYEGFDVLLDAVARLREQGHDVRALLVGEGTARPSLQAQAAALGLGDAAVFTGRVDRAAVVQHRDALDLFVVPRLDREVTRTVSPLKPVEAMASGRPLLVSALPPLLETIGGELEAAGAAVAPSDARALAHRIRDAATQQDLRARLTALGKQRAAELTWRRNGSTYRTAFRRIGADLPMWEDWDDARSRDR